MLARRLPGILPPLSREEALESSAIHSAWGSRLQGLLRSRPFRSPHHTASQPALVGGGSYPRPGEVSLAHNGVLFLDELPEIKRAVLEALRQPLEDREVSIARARGSLRLPARFQLVAAMNPCPCGFRGDARRGCRCTPKQIDAYQSRLSGPLLDRIDLHAPVAALPYAELAGPPGEPSAAIRGRVEVARQRQEGRSGPGRTNADLAGRELRSASALDAAGNALLARAMDSFGLTGRAHDRVLRVSRTLADLDGVEHVRHTHVAEALHYRGVESTD
jgi:magnesium chelatase family protein